VYEPIRHCWNPVPWCCCLSACGYDSQKMSIRHVPYTVADGSNKYGNSRRLFQALDVFRGLSPQKGHPQAPLGGPLWSASVPYRAAMRRFPVPNCPVMSRIALVPLCSAISHFVSLCSEMPLSISRGRPFYLKVLIMRPGILLLGLFPNTEERPSAACGNLREPPPCGLQTRLPKINPTPRVVMAVISRA